MNEIKAEILCEEQTDISTKVEIAEAADGKKEKSYYLEGTFLQADLKNGNERIYPKSVLSEAVDEYATKYIALGRGYGELSHPDPSDPGIHLNNVCILTKSLSEDGSNWFGRAKVIDTPSGKIVKNFIDEGVTLGVSSRGVGQVRGGVVQNGYRLVTAVDVVANPSAPEAFVNALVEGKEWVLENGVLVERQLDEMRDQVLGAKSKDLARVKIAAFRKFLNAMSLGG